MSPMFQSPLSANFAAKSSNKDEPDTRYFIVGYTQRSAKKHKTYDDAVMILSGRRCTLKSMENTIITSSFLSFSTHNLKVDSTLFVSNQEVVIYSVLPAAEYLSGRVFTSNLITPASDTASASAALEEENIQLSEKMAVGMKDIKKKDGRVANPAVDLVSSRATSEAESIRQHNLALLQSDAIILNREAIEKGNNADLCFGCD